MKIKKNMVVVGDNLEIMRGIDAGSIDLIYADPPFNTGKDWGAFNDKWEGGMKGYLKFMEPRLVEMHRLLKDTGSIYLHCDPNASHYLKVMMDTIFGRRNFKNEIVWHYQAGKGSERAFKRKHDTLFFYTKSNLSSFNRQSKPVINPKRYKYTDENGRAYDVNGQGNRYYLEEGQTCDDVWTYIHEKQFQQINSQAKESLGYPTQKPLAVLERIIKASSNPGDVVFDPFCGSGTTLVAAKTLGRKYIGIDQNPEAVRIAQSRLNPTQQELELM